MRYILFLAILFGVATGYVKPAAALTPGQWTNVCTNFLGLRSATTQVDTNGAGYGMDNGNTVPMTCLIGPIPPNWDALLEQTLTLILGFPNAAGRYLLIVSGCPGLTADYPGAFPKCNTVTGGVLTATPNTLANYDLQTLTAWVNANIPQ